MPAKKNVPCQFKRAALFLRCGVCLATYLVLAGCGDDFRSSLRPFLREHPEFEIGDLPDRCQGTVHAPRRIEKLEAEVIWSFEFGLHGPHTFLKQPPPILYKQYRNVYSSALGIEPMAPSERPAGIHAISGWIAEGHVVCDPEDPAAEFSGIIFIENAQLIAERKRIP